MPNSVNIYPEIIMIIPHHRIGGSNIFTQGNSDLSKLCLQLVNFYKNAIFLPICCQGRVEYQPNHQPVELRSKLSFCPAIRQPLLHPSFLSLQTIYYRFFYWQKICLFLSRANLEYLFFSILISMLSSWFWYESMHFCWRSTGQNIFFFLGSEHEAIWSRDEPAIWQ